MSQVTRSLFTLKFNQGQIRHKRATFPYYLFSKCRKVRAIFRPARVSASL